VERRRFVIGGLTVLALTGPATAQQAQRLWRIAYLTLSPRAAPGVNPIWDAFAEKMRELGYVEGQNLSIEWRSADGYADRLPALAAELVRLKPDVIVVPSTQTTLAAKQATTTIPIVMAAATDPVELGLVSSLARPGGNVTGHVVTGGELTRKRLQLLTEAVPNASRVAVLADPTNTSHSLYWTQTQTAAQALGVRLQRFEAGTPDEIDRAFVAIREARVDGLMVFPEPMFYNERSRIAKLAMNSRLPSVHGIKGHAEAGDLMAYGPEYRDLYRRTAIYVDKILKGTKPADLPVQEPTKFEFVINLKTAKALGLTIPQTLLLRADQVIE